MPQQQTDRRRAPLFRNRLVRTPLLRSLILGLLGAASLAACISTNSDPDLVYDPIEPVNREIFAFNDSVDEHVFEPVAEAYRDNLPATIRTGVGNVLRNLRSPVIFGNQILQGDINGAGNTLVRFIANTIGGLGGILDPAAENGFPFEDEDFGQTLAVWGLDSGPYLMVPILGPSNARDLVGFVVDSVSDPFSLIARNHGLGTDLSINRTGATGVDERSQAIEALRDIKSTSVDYYASIRSFYNQRREGMINDGHVSPDIPDFQKVSDWNDEDEDITPSILTSARPAEQVE